MRSTFGYGVEMFFDSLAIDAGYEPKKGFWPVMKIHQVLSSTLRGKERIRECLPGWRRSRGDQTLRFGDMSRKECQDCILATDTIIVDPRGDKGQTIVGFDVTSNPTQLHDKVKKMKTLRETVQGQLLDRYVVVLMNLDDRGWGMLPDEEQERLLGIFYDLVDQVVEGNEWVTDAVISVTP